MAARYPKSTLYLWVAGTEDACGRQSRQPQVFGFIYGVLTNTIVPFPFIFLPSKFIA